MKNKFLLLSTIISSCLFFIGNHVSADLHPGMPTGAGKKARCYPASRCNGDPNLIGSDRQCVGDQQYRAAQSGQAGQNQWSGNAEGQWSGAQGYAYGGSNGPGTSQGKVLQTESTENFSGVVKSVNRVQLPNEAQIQIVLTTEQGDMLVIVGPASFVDQSKIKLQAGDKVTVTGYRITANGKDVIVAAQIKRNGNTLQLLDENRMPQWGQSPGMQRGNLQTGGQYRGNRSSYFQNRY